MLRPAASLALLSILGALGPGCSGEEPAHPQLILLVTLDTLRADHLGMYGYERATTPFLDAFARRATVYERAQSTSPWTLPSHASLFTGTYPFEHGAHTVPVEPKERERFNNTTALDHRLPTLAEELRRAGYATGAVVANGAFLSPKYGLGRGFEHYVCRSGSVREVNERALAWLGDPAGGPVFLFLNYIDTHQPYNVEPRAGFPDVSGRRHEVRRICDRLMDGGGASPEELQLVIDSYDLAIANLDAGLEQLFGALGRRGWLEDAMVVLTSDHGEYLGEHGLVEHSKDVYQEALHVPLIVQHPGQQEGRRVRDWTSLAHVPRLVLEAAGLEADRLGGPEPSIALAENYGVRMRYLDEPWAARLNRIRRAVFEGEYKYIHSSDGEHELYDLSVDPGEARNVAHELPDVTSFFTERLRAFEAATRSDAAPVEIGAEDLEVLRELGYVGDEP